MKKGYGCVVAEIWWAGFAARKILREYRLKFTEVHWFYMHPMLIFDESRILYHNNTPHLNYTVPFQ